MGNLPKNWVLSNIEDSIDILDYMRKPVSASERAKRIGDIPYYGATGIAGKIDDYLFDEELVLLGEDGAPFLDYSKNVAYIISGKSWVNNHAHVLKAKKRITSNTFLLHYLNQFDYTDYVGGTTRLKLNQGNLKSIPFPLPPLAEQQRIVAKLDGLFGHLDSLKQRLELIPALLKQFRQSVLTQAVTGKLTGEQYHKIKLKEAVKFIGGGTPSKSNSNYWGGLIPWASVKDFKSHRILHKTQDSITLEGLNNSSSKIAKKGELLLITRMSPGRTVMTNIDVAINQDLKIIRPLTDLNVMFLSYWFESNIPLIESLSTGTTVKGIRVDVLNNIKIPIPTLKEQTEIVSRVENLFVKADTVEAAYQNLKQQIDSLPQAILAKAFKGELVEQLPTDGDAKELLKQIAALRASLEKEKKSKKKNIRNG